MIINLNGIQINTVDLQSICLCYKIYLYKVRVQLTTIKNVLQNKNLNIKLNHNR